MNLFDGFGEAEVAEAKRRFSEDRFVAIEKILGRTSPDAGLRYDLSYLLWKTLRNRRAGNANINKTRDALARIQRVAAALVSELAPMLAHPATNTAAADDAGTWLNLADDQWEPLEIEHIAERAASLSSAATEALKRIGAARPCGLSNRYRAQIHGEKQPVHFQRIYRKVRRNVLSIAEDLFGSRCRGAARSPSLGRQNEGPPRSLLSTK
jgi:hypothetical protein